MYKVEIDVFERNNPKIKGFLVKVGCKYYTYLSKEAMLKDLSLYYEFPKDAELLVNEMDEYVSGNKQKEMFENRICGSQPELNVNELPIQDSARREDELPVPEPVRPRREEEGACCPSSTGEMVPRG